MSGVSFTDILQCVLEGVTAAMQSKEPSSRMAFSLKCMCLFQITRNTTPMYRTPEMVDLYSNFPIGEKQDIWVRLRCGGARATLPVGAQGALRHRVQPAVLLVFPPDLSYGWPQPPSFVFFSHCFHKSHL